MNRITPLSAFAFFFLLSIPSFSFSQDILEKGISFEKALEKAKSQNKLLMLFVAYDDLEVSGIMENEVFQYDEIKKFYDKNFVCWRLDFATLNDGERFHGIKISALPEYIFLENNGKFRYRESGYKEPGEFIQTGKNALNDELSLTSMKKSYESGNRNPEFVRSFITNMDGAGENIDPLLDEYFKKLGKDKWINKDNLSMIYLASSDLGSPVIQYVLANYKYACKEMGELPVNNLIIAVYSDDLAKASKEKNQEGMKRCREAINQILPPAQAEIVNIKGEIYYFQTNEEWDKYIAEAEKLMSKNPAEDWGYYNDLGWNFYMHTQSPEKLKKALSWVEMSLEQDQNYYNLNTLACLYFALGDLENAKKFVAESINAAENAGIEYPESEELMKKIEQKIGK